MHGIRYRTSDLDGKGAKALGSTMLGARTISTVTKHKPAASGEALTL